VHLQAADCEQTMGLRIDEVVAHWRRLRGWQGPDDGHVVTAIVDAVIGLVMQQGAALAGVGHALTVCRSAGLRMALASSSPRRLIDATLRRLGLEGQFEVVCSGEHEPHGKPHPAVFLTTASRLGVEPQACLVFEDSLPGVIAAKAARMHCVAVPMAAQRSRPQFALADLVLPSLAAVDRSVLDRLG
jgi:sugar-phosphatase